MKFTSTSAWTVLRMLATLVVTLNAHGHSNQNEFSRIVEQRALPGQFAGAVLVMRGSQVLLNKGYGSANVEWQIANSPSTRFRIASLTKQFTAAGILLLQERGQLQIDDLISRYVPDTPATWSTITIRELLTHTSGIPDLTRFPDFSDIAVRPMTPEKLVSIFREKALDFPPGNEFRYSNSGYIILGYIIEKVSAQSYEQFIHQNIFTPLHMEHSGYDSNTSVIPMRAQGYARTDKGLAIADYLNMTVPFSAGGLYSTTGDLLSWERGLFGGHLLTADSLTSMTTPLRNSYAFGVAVDLDEGGKKVVWHGGAIDGFTSFLAHVPDDDLVVVVLANMEGAQAKAIGADILTAAGHRVQALASK